MRETYERYSRGNLSIRYTDQCNQTETSYSASDYVLLEFKSGGSSNSPVRPDGSRAPNSCDLSQGVSRVYPYVMSYRYQCGVRDGVKLYSITTIDTVARLEKYSSLSPSLVDQETINEAVRRWYAKLADFRANIAADIATYRQTVDMVTSRTRQIAEAAKQLKRRNLRGFLDVLGLARRGELRNNFASTWLEYHYGWVPILSDIHEILSIESNRALRSTIRVSHRKTGVYVGAPPNNWDHPKRAVNATFNDIVTVRAVCTLLNPNRVTFSQLGLDNPALLAWELLPYSFVVDWFVPIGPYLESQTAAGNFQITDASVTSTRHTNLQAIYYDNVPEFLSPGRMLCEGYRKVRNIGIPPMPLPSFGIPSFNLTRFFNATALLSLQFRRNSWSI